MDWDIFSCGVSMYIVPKVLEPSGRFFKDSLFFVPN